MRAFIFIGLAGVLILGCGQDDKCRNLEGTSYVAYRQLAATVGTPTPTPKVTPTPTPGPSSSIILATSDGGCPTGNSSVGDCQVNQFADDCPTQ